MSALQFSDLMKLFKLVGIIVCVIGSVVGKLHLSKVIVPPYKMYQERARLDCPFDLGKDRLYAVKWYKDNEEFFRYVPRYRPPIYVHPVDGINVIMEGSDQKFVTLGPLDLRYTGVYKCEVSAEGPSFASVSGEGRMTVVHLPKEGPQISGKTRDEYETDDQLALNCTSAKSFPPARLSWYINDIPIEHGVKHIKPRNRMGGRLLPVNLEEEQSESTLNLTLAPEHFNENGEAKVRCVATISTLFWQDGDERVVGNSRKTATDFRYSSTNSFNSVASSPVFQDDREASLLVRGGAISTSTQSSMWNVTVGVFFVLLATDFLTFTSSKTATCKSKTTCVNFPKSRCKTSSQESCSVANFTSSPSTSVLPANSSSRFNEIHLKA